MSNVIERLEKGELEIVKTSETKIINIGQFKDGKIKIAVHDEMSTAELLRLAKLGQQMQWVSVVDKLPEKDDDVLVWVGVTCVRACIGNTPYGQAWYLVDKHCYLNMYNVTHWMPLPPNPKEVQL